MSDNPYAPPTADLGIVLPERSGAPVDLPDAAIHKICIRCRRWFQPEDGKMALPPVMGPISGIRALIAAATGDPAARRFVCWRCVRRHRMARAILGVVFVVLFALLLFS